MGEGYQVKFLTLCRHGEIASKVICDTPKDRYRNAGMFEAWFDVLITRKIRERCRAVTEELTVAPLALVDRCDRCGAQAFVRAILPSGRELLFCGHHAKEYSVGLQTASASIQDETARISQ